MGNGQINPSGLITDEEVPPDTTRVDRTNFPPSEQELSQMSIAEVDKRLRDFGLRDPANQGIGITQREGGQLAIVDSGTGEEIFRGPPEETQSVFERVRAAQRRLIESGGPVEDVPPPAAERPEPGAPLTEQIEMGPDAPGLIQQIADRVRAGQFFSGGSGPRMGPDETVELAEGEGGQSIIQSIIGSLQGGGGSQTRAQPQTEEVEEVEQPEPQEALERAAPQGASAQDVAELIDPGTATEAPVAGPEATGGTQVRGGPDIPQRSSELAISDVLSQLGPREGPTEEQIQQAREEAEIGIGERLRRFARDAGKALEQPEVQRGLAQLAQLFVQPESGTGRLARRQAQAATKQIQAEQVRALVEGEDVEAASPEVVRQAEEIKQSKRRTEQQERRLDLRKKELQLQRQQQLFELAQATRKRKKGEELKGFEIDAINQQAIGEFLPRVLQQVDQSRGLQIISQLQAAENPSPEIIRSQLSEEQQEEFDRFRNRLQEAVLSGDQGALFGVVQEGEEEGGEGEQAGLTLSSSDPEELRNVFENASTGSTIQVTQQIELPSGKTLAPGQYRVSDDGSLEQIGQ